MRRVGRIVDVFKDVHDYELCVPANGKRYRALERAVASGAQICGQQYLARRTVDRGGIGHRSSPNDNRNASLPRARTCITIRFWAFVIKQLIPSVKDVRNASIA